jgi:hypothetical protein
MDHHILLKLLISLTMLFTVYETFADDELLKEINSDDATPALKSMTSVKWITKSKVRPLFSGKKKDTQIV